MANVCMKIAIWGCGTPVLNILSILRQANFEICYIKVDSPQHVDNNFLSILSKENIPCYFDEYPSYDLDLIFVINYNKIIPEDVINSNLVVNYHIGLLPKWRGNSANGWGIINGENYVGYTIHRVNELLDDGPIYYQYKYPYSFKETYNDARIEMDKDFYINLPNTLCKIIQSPDNYLNFPNEGIVYCSKFRPVDGVINWNASSEEIIRRFYVFSRPRGTGLKLLFKNHFYEVSALSLINNFAKSIGIPGGVINKVRGSVWIKTLDTAISIDEIRDENGIVAVDSLFTIGQRL